MSLRIGEAVAFDVSLSAGGLLAIGALVSGILLASSVIVVAAKRRGATGVPMLP